MYIKFIAGFACILCMLNNCVGYVNLDPEKKQQIDDFVNRLLFDCDKHEIPGMNLAVVYQGETIYTTGYGVRDLELPDRVTENTLFCIASVSKHFTTTLLGQKLLENGYTWDTPVREILSDLGTDFYFYDPLRTNRTTLRDLAAHSAGILRHDAVWIQNMTREEQASRLRFLEGTNEPRTDFDYNNLMYVLLGHITELLTGVKWEELVQTEIYDRLGMSNSTFDDSVPSEDKEVASFYMLDGTELREITWETNVEMFGAEDVSPAGGIVSTANDMAQWMKMLLADGQNEAGEEVFSSDVIAEIRLPVNAYSAILPNQDPFLPPKSPVRFEQFRAYGLGLGLGSYRGYRSVHHNGAAFGQYSDMFLYPDVQLGIYTNINGVEQGVGAMVPISMFVADVVLGEEPWLNASSACSLSAPNPAGKQGPGAFRSTREQIKETIFYNRNRSTEKEKAQMKKTVSLEKVDQLVGRYGNFAYGNITIVVDDISGDVIAQYDIINCTLLLKPNGESYFCQGQGDYWFAAVLDLRFDSQSSPAEFVDILFSSPVEGVDRFTRNLRMTDAPGPRDHWTIC